MLAKQSSSTSSHLEIFVFPHEHFSYLCLSWDCQLKDWEESILWLIMLFTCHGMFIFVQLHQQQQQELTTSRECTSIVQIVITCTSNAQILNYRFLRENHVLFLSNVCPSLSSYLLPIPFVEVAQQQRDEVVELSDLLLVIILQRILKTLLQPREGRADLNQDIPSTTSKGRSTSEVHQICVPVRDTCEEQFDSILSKPLPAAQ